MIGARLCLIHFCGEAFALWWSVFLLKGSEMRGG